LNRHGPHVLDGPPELQKLIGRRGNIIDTLIVPGALSMIVSVLLMAEDNLLMKHNAALLGKGFFLMMHNALLVGDYNFLINHVSSLSGEGNLLLKNPVVLIGEGNLLMKQYLAIWQMKREKRQRWKLISSAVKEISGLIKGTRLNLRDGCLFQFTCSVTSMLSMTTCST